MLQTIQANLGTICLFLVSLLAVSESSPFIKRLRANGILEAIYLKFKGEAILRAKEEIANLEAEEAAAKAQEQKPE